MVMTEIAACFLPATAFLPNILPICKDSWASHWKSTSKMPLQPNLHGSYSSSVLAEAPCVEQRPNSLQCLFRLTQWHGISWDHRSWKQVNRVVTSVWVLNAQHLEIGSCYFRVRRTSWEVVCQMLPSARARDQLPILVAGGPKLAEKKREKKAKNWQTNLRFANRSY